MIFKKIRNIYRFLRWLYSHSSIRNEYEITKLGERAYYTNIARKKAKDCGIELRVNHKSVFGGTVHFGDNCNFNGMNVAGGGKSILEITFIQESNV